MKHIKSSFYFESESGKESWKVDYVYGESFYRKLSVIVYLNNDIYWHFESLPHTRTTNQTKTHAREILAIAKKLYKEEYKIRDEREKI